MENNSENIVFLNYCQILFFYMHITLSMFFKKKQMSSRMQVTLHRPLTGNINPDALNSNWNLRHKSTFSTFLQNAWFQMSLSIYKNMWTQIANIKNNKYKVICRAQCKSETLLLITGYWISSISVLTSFYPLLPQAANLDLLSYYQFSMNASSMALFQSSKRFWQAEHFLEYAKQIFLFQ